MRAIREFLLIYLALLACVVILVGLIWGVTLLIAVAPVWLWPALAGVLALVALGVLADMIRRY